jgi:putative N-acetylmannosamine-6-phosphate epimerase
MTAPDVSHQDKANAIRALSMDAVEAAASGHPGMPMGMADVATVEDGVAAALAGADVVATTLSGYTGAVPAARDDPPDFDLIAALVAAIAVPVVAEGRLWTPDHVAQALGRGAHCVVIGTAITNPRDITRRFVAGTRAS